MVGKIFKWIGIFLAAMVVLLFASVALDSITGVPGSHDIYFFVLKYISPAVVIFIGFFLVIDISNELDSSNFFIDIIAFIFGGVGYLLCFKGSPYGVLLLICMTGLTSLGLCDVMDSAFSYYEETKTTYYKWDEWFEDFFVDREERKIDYIDKGYIGFIIHLLIYVVPVWIFAESEPVVLLILFILLCLRTLFRNFFNIYLLIRNFFYMIFHEPLRSLKYVGLVALLVGGGILVGNIIDNKGIDLGQNKEQQNNNGDNGDNSHDNSGDGNEGHTVSYKYYDLGQVTKEATCESDGVYTFKNESGGKDLTYTYHCKHDLDSNNHCKNCDFSIETSPEFLYEVIEEPSGSKHVEIYAYLPSNKKQLVVAPYINNIPVKDIHISAYNRNFATTDESINDNVDHKVNTIEDYDLYNIYERTLNQEVTIYPSSIYTNVYVDSRYDYDNLSKLTVIGDINLFVSRADPDTMIFEGNVKEYHSVSSPYGMNVFMGLVNKISCNHKLNQLDTDVLVIPKAAQYIDIYGIYLRYYSFEGISPFYEVDNYGYLHTYYATFKCCYQPLTYTVDPSAYITREIDFSYSHTSLNFSFDTYHRSYYDEEFKANNYRLVTEE